MNLQITDLVKDSKEIKWTAKKIDCRIPRIKTSDNQHKQKAEKSAEAPEFSHNTNRETNRSQKEYTDISTWKLLSKKINTWNGVSTSLEYILFFFSFYFFFYFRFWHTDDAIQAISIIIPMFKMIQDTL